MISNLRLKALAVDDIEWVPQMISHYLSEVDIDVTSAFSNEDAFQILEYTVLTHSQLDIITTDIVREEKGGTGEKGIQFVRRIRNLPDDVTVSGGLRLRHVPIVVISGNAHRAEYVKELIEIDPSIRLMEKPVEGEKLVVLVDEALCDYRNRMLSELQHIGMAFVWQSGYFKVVDAYALPPLSKVETKYFVGNSDALGRCYSKLVLVSDRWNRAQIVLKEFESLLDYPNSTEKDFQRFFELHPEFLLQDEYGGYWAEPVIESPATHHKIRPDFVLQPRTLRANSWNWAVVDLKRPNVPIITHKRFHADLSHHVYRVVTQLKDYEDFFLDPRNHEIIKRRFGGVSPRPKLVAIIGRLPNEHRDQYAILRSRFEGISITTYDELLEFRRAKVEWAKSLGL